VTTDHHGRDHFYNSRLLAVFGHESAGVVAEVAKDVTKFTPAITSSSRSRRAARTRGSRAKVFAGVHHEACRSA
jgi:threonine dehydrogenase-like Zn-dependent dehydrogenase